MIISNGNGALRHHHTNILRVILLLSLFAISQPKNVLQMNAILALRTNVLHRSSPKMSATRLISMMFAHGWYGRRFITSLIYRKLLLLLILFSPKWTNNGCRSFCIRTAIVSNESTLHYCVHNPVISRLS